MKRHLLDHCWVKGLGMRWPTESVLLQSQPIESKSRWSWTQRTDTEILACERGDQAKEHQTSWTSALNRPQPSWLIVSSQSYDSFCPRSPATYFSSQACSTSYERTHSRKIQSSTTSYKASLRSNPMLIPWPPLAPFTFTTPFLFVRLSRHRVFSSTFHRPRLD